MLAVSLMPAGLKRATIRQNVRMYIAHSVLMGGVNTLLIERAATQNALGLLENLTVLLRLPKEGALAMLGNLYT